MKALEKAAKDRGAAKAEPQPSAAPPQAKAELTLEPIGPAAGIAPGKPKIEPRLVVEPPAPAPPLREQGAAAQEQAQAATVLQAARRQRRGVWAYVSGHPITVFGTLAGLFLTGYGAYVYLQITSPGLFIRQAPRPPQPLAPSPLAKAPAPSATAQAELPQPAPLAAAAPQPALPAPLLAGPALEASAPQAVQQRAPDTQAAPAAAPAPAAPAVRDKITVSTGGAAATVNPLLAEAFGAIEAGRHEAAEPLYNEVLRGEPKNVDALLGLGAIAAQRGDADLATRRYLEVLELEPRHALAQAGLIALLGRADPLSAETRLKQLIAREPSAFLHFTLGNLYADRSLWAQAQQAYFQAFHLQPDNPDYAYNLAIGLEHLSQGKLALGFYQRALELAAAKGRANFNLDSVRERVAKLSTQVE
ncbi:MAG: hypothetical protein HY323_16700 [Betaproteobacteria bacterium]|nr:hypothetical protein [Betaproteobacteria bacterium]